MKKMALGMAVIMMLSVLCACRKQAEAPPVSSQPEVANDLISDLPSSHLRWDHRQYDLSFLIDPLEDSGRRRADKNTSVEELYRFVYHYTERHSRSLETVCFVVDLRSNRIYYYGDVNSGGGINDVLYAEQIVEITDKDLLFLKKAISDCGVRAWKESYQTFFGDLFEGDRWDVAIEYKDGSVEQHGGHVRPKGLAALEAFIAAQASGYPARVREQRKTATHIDYLLADRDWLHEAVPLDTMDLTDATVVERILVFQAKSPHGGQDHSRQPQKTLLLDVLNGTMYFEPVRTVYENIALAESVSALDHGLLGRVTELFRTYDVQLWNQTYFGNTDLYMYSEDIPAWCVTIQLTDGRLVRCRGDGMGEGGSAPGCQEMLAAIWAEMG